MITNINTQQIIIEQSAEYGSDLYLVFVDFEKAFDSVYIERFWMVLRRRGIPNKLLSIIESTYNDAKCRVLHNSTLSTPFVVDSGVS